MAADLSVRMTLRRLNLLLDEDALVILEQQSVSDRMRRILLDRVESVVTWRRPAWVALALITIFLGLPGLGVILIGVSVDEVVVLIIGGIILAVAAALLFWFIFCGQTTVRITRAGTNHEFTVTARPSTVRRF